MEPRDHELEAVYSRGTSINQIFGTGSVGIVTSRDSLAIDEDRNALWFRVRDFASGDPEALRARYNLGKDVRDWRVEWAQADVQKNLSRENLKRISYRPFDTQWTFFTGNSRGFLCYPRTDVMRHDGGEHRPRYRTQQQESGARSISCLRPHG